MRETLVRVFIGDFDHDIPKASVTHPADPVDDSGADRSFVAQQFGLTLVEQTQDDDGIVPVTGADYALHALQVISAQGPVWLERGIHRTFITRHPALQAEG